MGWHIFRRTAVAFAISLLATSSAVSAQEPATYPRATKLRIERDWKRGEVRFSLQESLAPYLQRGNRATAAYAANQRWREHFDIIIPYVLDDIPYNRTDTVLSWAQSAQRARSVSARAGALATLTYNGLGADFSSVEARYRLPFYPAVLSLLPSSSRAVERHHNWVASKNYSGVVIIATDALPLHGTADVYAQATPALSPVIYDEQLRVVLAAAMVNQAVRQRHGAVGYDRAYDTVEWYWRVGGAPLLIYAHSLYNAAGTDIIISAADSAKILTRADNRRLVTAGRFLLVVNAVNTVNFLTIDLD